MKFIRKIPKLLPDNDLLFINHLEGIVNSIDEFCYGEVEKSKDEFIFRLNPSIPGYINDIISQVNNVNNYFHIHVEFSKSIKSTNIITFKIKPNE